MSRIRTGDPALIREINLSIVLNALRDHASTSRAALAASTGLTKVTVSALVQQLTQAGFITERGIGKAALGRPGILLELNPQAGGMIGVEIGVDFISLLLTDFSARVIWRHHEQTDRRAAQATLLKHIIANIRAAIKQAERHDLAIFGLSIGLPGLVDVAAGVLLYAPNLKWRNVPLRQLLSEHFDFPIHVDNEASIAAFGQSFFGAARGKRNMVYVHAGVGIGGGLVLNGQIVTGATGFAGEVGHVTIEPEGPLCNCGNHGCWETFASESAVFERVQQGIAAGKSTHLARLKNGKGEQLTIPLIVEAAEQGDLAARQALCETGMYLGIGIANLINTLNPEMVVLGGTLSLAKDFILPVIQETINERALSWSVKATQVVIAADGSDACLMGGIATIYDQVLRHPLQTRRVRATA
ncbi:MAG: ROK family transcriptional regulator [Chloroflexi bacterium]|nr:ROK family transcriptional regulator [Chloroflexota bacterium]